MEEVRREEDWREDRKKGMQEGRGRGGWGEIVTMRN